MFFHFVVLFFFYFVVVDLLTTTFSLLSRSVWDPQALVFPFHKDILVRREREPESLHIAVKEGQR